MKKYSPFIFALAAFFIPSAVLFACSCMMQSVEEALESSDAVFVAEVENVSAQTDIQGSNMTPIQVQVKVSEVFKGDVSEQTHLTTPSDSAACGYAFTEGETYLMYAHEDDDGQLSVNLCSRTALRADAEDDVEELEDLTDSHAPEKSDDTAVVALMKKAISLLQELINKLLGR